MITAEINDVPVALRGGNLITRFEFTLVVHCDWLCSNLLAFCMDRNRKHCSKCRESIKKDQRQRRGRGVRWCRGQRCGMVWARQSEN